jgi:hypothetical protein
VDRLHNFTGPRRAVRGLDARAATDRSRTAARKSRRSAPLTITGRIAHYGARMIVRVRPRSLIKGTQLPNSVDMLAESGSARRGSCRAAASPCRFGRRTRGRCLRIRVVHLAQGSKRGSRQEGGVEMSSTSAATTGHRPRSHPTSSPSSFRSAMPRQRRPHNPARPASRSPAAKCCH